MRILFLSPSSYTIPNTLKQGFIVLNHDFYHSDYRQNMKNWENKFNIQSRRFPHVARSKWNNYYLKKINDYHVSIFNSYHPDIVMIYNNEMLLPSTLSFFKKKGSKVVFLMGDNPYYTYTNDYYLPLLLLSDLIIVPDSFWEAQLRLLGLKNISLDFLYSFVNQDHKKKTESKQHNSDLLFIGECYSDSWGYKRVLFVSKFAELDIEVHGSGMWQRWLEFFPELKSKFILKTSRYSDEHINQLFAGAKIYPVDANPGLLNGIHLRVFDCIGYGLLPLPEYRKDIESVFINTGLPLIKDYNEAASIAQYYIDNEKERLEIIKNMRNVLRQKFIPEKFVSRILDKL